MWAYSLAKKSFFFFFAKNALIDVVSFLGCAVVILHDKTEFQAVDPIARFLLPRQLFSRVYVYPASF